MSRSRRAPTAVVWVASALASALALPALGAQPLVVGVGAHFGQAIGDADALMPRLAEAGVDSIRDEVYWSRVEGKAGRLRWPRLERSALQAAWRAGLKPLLILDYGHKAHDGGGYPHTAEGRAAFVRYATWMATQTRGRVCALEVWNEWGGIPRPPRDAPERASPEAYVRVLAEVSPALRRAAPGTPILGGWLDAAWGNEDRPERAWLDRALRAGLLDHIDGYSAHPYMYRKRPESGRRRDTAEAWLERMDALQDTLRRHRGGQDVPVWVTEIGWPTHTGADGSAEPEQARQLVRLLLLAGLRPWLVGVWWYDLLDDGWKPHAVEQRFGLLRTDGTAKPAWHALRDVARFLRRHERPTRLATPLAGDATKPPAALEVLRFVRRDGLGESWALWSSDETRRFRVEVAVPDGPGTWLRVRHAGQGHEDHPVRVRRWWKHREASPRPGRLSVVVGPDVTLIEGLPRAATDTEDGEAKAGGGATRAPRGAALAAVEARAGGEAVVIANKLRGARPPDVLVAPHGPPQRRRSAGRQAAAAPAFALTTWRGLRGPDGRQRVDRKLPAPGERDLSASCAVHWRDSPTPALTLRCVVRDDVHAQPFGADPANAAKTWRGDSLQLALHPLPPHGGQAPRWPTLVNAALTEAGPRLYRHRAHDGSAPGVLSDVELQIQRDERTATTTYRLTLPAARFGLGELRHGAVVGAAVLVNDRDGAAAGRPPRREGFVRWGGGIGDSHDPGRYGWWVLGPP